MKTLKPLFLPLMGILLITASIFCLFILPLLNGSTMAKFFILMTYALFAYTYWQVLHEAIHNHFFKNKKRNHIGGRIMAILFGAPFHVLQIGHLTHHAMNRELGDRTEIVTRTGNFFVDSFYKIKYYTWLLGGLYVAEVLGMICGFVKKDYLLKMADKAKTNNPVKARVLTKLSQHIPALRLDAIMIVLVYGLSFMAYGAQAWMLLMVIIIRALMVSLFDNIYHYGTPLDKKKFANNLELPAWLSLMFLHANYHGVHHQHPKLRWDKLPEQMAIDQSHFHARFLTQLIKEIKGPVVM